MTCSDTVSSHEALQECTVLGCLQFQLRSGFLLQRTLCNYYGANNYQQQPNMITSVCVDNVVSVHVYKRPHYRTL